MKPTLPQATKIELTELLDTAADSPKGLVYKVPPSRAKYLLNAAKNLKLEEAVLSAQMREEGDELYGKGLYWDLQFELVPQGLKITKLAEADLTFPEMLVMVCLLNKEITIEEATAERAEKTYNTITTYQARLAKRSANLEDWTIPNIDRLQVYVYDKTITIKLPGMSPDKVVLLDDDENPVDEPPNESSNQPPEPLDKTPDSP